MKSKPKRISICKSFAFEAAHHLPDYEGKCRNVHGHRWEGEVVISCAEKDLKQGMVIDFSDLKTILNILVVEKYDHKDLNQYFENPTCETICAEIYDAVSWHLERSKFDYLRLESVRLYETPGNYCVVEGWTK